jgi:hypothetical protein
MRVRYVLAAAAVVAVIGIGSAVAWAAGGTGSGPSVWSHPAVSQMHDGVDRADLDRMADACEKVMKGGRMMDADGIGGMMDADDMGGRMDGPMRGMMGNR